MNMNMLIDEIKKKVGLVGHLSSIISDVGIRDIIYMSLEEFNRVSSFEIRVPISNFLHNIIGYNSNSSFPNSYSPGYTETAIAPELLVMIEASGVRMKNAELHRSPNSFALIGQTTMKEDMKYIKRGHHKGANSAMPNIRVRQPNMLVIEGLVGDLSYYQAYEMVMKVTHPRTLSTISAGLERWFENLCRLNVEIVLYNNDIRYLNIDIGSIRVELSADNFSSAASDKVTLMENMVNRAAADQVSFSYGS